MKAIRSAILFTCICFLAAACGSGANEGHSNPIDSSNVKGSAPASYGPNDPARDEIDSNRTNVNDTGTKPNNIHNIGTYK